MKTAKTAPKTLTDDEVRRLLQVTGRAERDLRDHVLLLLAVSTGLRVSEVVALDVGDVRNGKGVRTIIELRPETTKGNRPGEIVLPDRVRRKLVQYLAWKVKHGQATEDAAPLFVSRGGGPGGARRGARLSIRSAEQLFTIWQAKAGFDRVLNFHALRHSFATRMLRATKNLRLVQLACRHANIATTTVYTHPSLEDRVRGAETFEW